MHFPVCCLNENLECIRVRCIFDWKPRKLRKREIRQVRKPLDENFFSILSPDLPVYPYLYLTLAFLLAVDKAAPLRT